MFRTTRLAALGLALAAFGAMDLPVSAQGTVREHRGRDTPPAPTPRPARANLSKEPRQWEIRNVTGIKADELYEIYNLRRDEMDLSSELAFEERDSRDATGWGQNGGRFVFKRDTASTNVRDHRTVRDGEFVAIYNTKTKRYMSYIGVWEDKPQYVWMMKKQEVVGQGRAARFRFALFNTDKRKWLMVCQGEPMNFDDRSLCLYDDTFKPMHKVN
jgi:hypothetical protein